MPTQRDSRLWRHSLRAPAEVLCVLTVLSACATSPQIDTSTEEDLNTSAWAREFEGSQNVVHWDHVRFGNQKPTRYSPTVHQGRPAVLAESEGGNSTLRLQLVPPQSVDASWLRFAWQIPALNERADLRNADIDDAAAEIIRAFAGYGPTVRAATPVRSTPVSSVSIR